MELTFCLYEGEFRGIVHISRGEGDGIDETMPFSIGSHITFNFPFVDGCEWSDGRLCGSASFESELTSLSLLSGERRERPLFAAGGMSLGDPDVCNMVISGWDGDAALDLIQPGVSTAFLCSYYCANGK